MESLEARWPDVCPDPQTSADAVRIKMGEVGVVRFLRHHYDKQNATTLSGA